MSDHTDDASSSFGGEAGVLIGFIGHIERFGMLWDSIASTADPRVGQTSRADRIATARVPV